MEIEDYADTIRTHFGEPTDGAKLLCIPGLDSTPDDYDVLRRHLRVDVIQSPFRKRKVDALPRESGWLKAYRDAIRKRLDETGIPIVLGHSCGCFDAVEVSQGNEQVRGIVLMNYPDFSKEVFAPGEPRLSEPNYSDMLLSGLCPDMDVPTYATFIEARSKLYPPQDTLHYKNIYKQETPLYRSEREHVRKILSELLQNVLVLSGKKDPWRYESLESSLGEQLPSHSFVTIDAGHYPHVSQPQNVAQIISTWMALHHTALLG